MEFYMENDDVILPGPNIGSIFKTDNFTTSTTISSQHKKTIYGIQKA